MHWFTLIRHFVSVASQQGDAIYLRAPVVDAEGWVSLDQLFAGQNFWAEKYWQDQARFSAALLEDIGFLRRRERGEVTEYRATFKAYVSILRWPGLDEFGVEGENDSQE